MKEKAKLLEAIAGKNRGLLVTDTDKVNILSAVERLEDYNPHPNPLQQPQLLEGDWRLLYTSSRSILGLGRFPLLQLGQIYQCIRTQEAKVYNIAEIIGIPLLEGIVSVTATFEIVSDRRVNVNFQRSIIGLQRIMGYSSPSQMIEALEQGKQYSPLDFKIDSREQKGWLEITYIDDDLRIGRGNEGNIFILSKEK